MAFERTAIPKGGKVLMDGIFIFLGQVQRREGLIANNTTLAVDIPVVDYKKTKCVCVYTLYK